MSRVFRKLKKANKVARNLYKLLLLGYIISFIFFAKNIISLTGIETVIRYVLLVALVIYFLFYLYKGLQNLLEKKYGWFYLKSFITLILIVIFSLGSIFIDDIYGKISGLKEKDKITYTSYLVSLKGTKLNNDSVLGMIDDSENIEGNILAKEIIKKNNLKQEVKEYSDNGEEDAFIAMLYDLYDKKVDAIFLSSNYVTLYSGEERFTNIATETKVLYQESKEYDNKNNMKSTKSLTEPFTVLILGVDSETNGLNANAAFNGDTLILATFNPKTFTATLLSIPRDTYVPIACRNGANSKINSSAAYGTECVIDTIQDLTDVTIDYYVKINFKGVVDLVETVGGITVDVEEPYFSYNHGFPCGDKVCEQDSNREWDNPIFITPGEQVTLNGEQALAYSRNRAQYIESDLARNRHQQDVIMALAKKMLHVKSYNDFQKILESVSNNIATNMSTNQILSSYNIFKDMIGRTLNDEEFINIQRTKLETYSLPVYLPSSGMTTSALGYYEASLNDIKKAMNINLGKEEAEMIKTFSYSINEEYEEYVAGANLRSGSTNGVLSSLIGNTKAEAENYCNSNNLSCAFTYVDDNSKYYDASKGADVVVHQSQPSGILIKEAGSITFYVNGATAKKEKTPVQEPKKEEPKKTETDTTTSNTTGNVTNEVDNNIVNMVTNDETKTEETTVTNEENKDN